MSAPSKNTQKAVSHQPPEVVRHGSTAARAESKAHEESATKTRQPGPQDPRTLTTTSVSPQNTQETFTNLPFATPDQHSTDAHIQSRTPKNAPSDPGHAAHPNHQPSLRDPDEYLKIFARISKLRPKLYCICRRPEGDADMVECSNGDECSIGWYHAACVGMTVLPGPGDDWFCQRCQERKTGRLAEPGEAGKPATWVLFNPNLQRRADPDSSTSEALPASTTRAVMTPRSWSKDEQAAVQVLMQEITAEGTRGEGRFEEVARRLAEQYGFEGRTGTSVRGHWNRAGKAASEAGQGGVKGGSMVAGVAKASQKARGKKRAEESEEDEEDEDEEENEEDEGDDGEEMAEEE